MANKEPTNCGECRFSGPGFACTHPDFLKLHITLVEPGRNQIHCPGFQVDVRRQLLRRAQEEEEEEEEEEEDGRQEDKRHLTRGEGKSPRNTQTA